MRAIQLPLALLFGLLFLTSAQQQTYVYICDSTGAKVYHYDKNCGGLNACTHAIKAVTLDEATGTYGRRLCGWED